MNGAPHAFLPPVGDLAQIVPVVAMLDHLEGVFLIEHDVYRKVHVGGAQAGGVESQEEKAERYKITVEAF